MGLNSYGTDSGGVTMVEKKSSGSETENVVAGAQTKCKSDHRIS